MKVRTVSTLPLRNGPNCLDRHAADSVLYNARVEHQPHVVDANGFRMRSLSDVFRHDCLIIGEFLSVVAWLGC